MTSCVNVACWTKLTIPTSQTIEEKTSDDGRRWLLASANVNPDKAPGFYAQFFGRMTESPKTVWYITAWDSSKSLDDYEKSEAYRLQRVEYAKLSSSPLETHRCDVDSQFWNHITENVGFIDAYFPASISNESKQIVIRACGLRYRWGPEDEAYKHRPVRGWLHGTQEYEGQEAVVVRFWNFWRSRESEQRFRVTDGVADPKQEYYLGIYEQFMEQLEKAGMLGIKEFHCSLLKIRNYWRPPEELPSSDEEHPSDEDPVDEDPVDEDPVDEDPVDEDPVEETLVDGIAEGSMAGAKNRHLQS